jgi:hypothetical protein
MPVIGAANADAVAMAMIFFFMCSPSMKILFSAPAGSVAASF